MLKTFFSTLALAALLLLVGVSPASAGREPCWKTVLRDAYSDQHVDGTYPVTCYTAALQHVPADVDAYTNTRGVINRALLAAIHDRGARDRSTDRQTSGPIALGGGGGTGPTAGGTGGGEGGGGGAISRLISSLGPKNASSIPLPLLVLAVIALLLLGAGAASVIARRIQARRLEVAPVPAPTEPKP